MLVPKWSLSSLRERQAKSFPPCGTGRECVSLGVCVKWVSWANTIPMQDASSPGNKRKQIVNISDCSAFCKFYSSCEDRRAWQILPACKSSSCSSSSGQVLGMKYLTYTVASACRQVTLKPTALSKDDSDQLTEQKLSITNPLWGNTFLVKLFFPLLWSILSLKAIKTAY